MEATVVIEGLPRLLAASSRRPPAGLAVLRALLSDLLGPAGRALEPQRLQGSVFRLAFDIEGRRRSVIAKWMKPDVAWRSQQVARRWLPAVGLERHGPPLLGTAADPAGAGAWHVYDDLGDHGLGETVVEHARLDAAVRLVAQLHRRFAGHPLLAECRMWGGDLGMRFYDASVTDAARCLEALGPGLAPPQEALRRRLLDRLAALQEQRPARAAALEALGVPETLLHGDLWPKNVFVLPGGHARLIDWDHAAAGPVTCDLSTFVYRRPAGDRGRILRVYREEMAAAGWTLPPDEALEALFETAELARVANRVIWPALSALRGEEGAWPFEALAEIEGWFAALNTFSRFSSGSGEGCRSATAATTAAAGRSEGCARARTHFARQEAEQRD